MTRDTLRQAGLSVLMVLAAVLVAAAILRSAGYDVTGAGMALWRGALGSSSAVISATLKRTTPLLFLGLAVAVAFRAGVLNIGADGQFLVGGAAAVVAGLALAGQPASVTIPTELAAGAVGGAAWAAIAAWLRARFEVAEVVSTLLLNMVAVNLVGFLVRGPMQEPTHAYPQSGILPQSARLPSLVAGEQLHWGFIAALCACAFAAWSFNGTAAGFRAKAVGLNPSAAESAGRISVARVRAFALITSGAIAGVAGFSEVTGVTYALYEGLSPGYGYMAIAVALLGALQPMGIVVAAVFFGALNAGADAMQRDANIPAAMASIIAGLVVLGVVTTPELRRQFRRNA